MPTRGAHFRNWSSAVQERTIRFRNHIKSAWTIESRARSRRSRVPHATRPALMTQWLSAAVRRCENRPFAKLDSLKPVFASCSRETSLAVSICHPAPWLSRLGYWPISCHGADRKIDAIIASRPELRGTGNTQSARFYDDVGGEPLRREHADAGDHLRGLSAPMRTDVPGTRMVVPTQRAKASSRCRVATLSAEANHCRSEPDRGIRGKEQYEDFMSRSRKRTC
jgi:hypothetical protein